MVGDVYELKVDCLGNKTGTQGIVFNDYRSGEQLIFPNGEYDGFSTEEKSEFLTYVCHSSKHENYVFVNVMKVSEDFRRRFWF